MKTKFIILLNNSNDSQNQKFVEFAKENGLGWWNWLGNSWLLVDPYCQFKASEIRSKVKEIYPNSRNLVIEINNKGDSWSGFGPNSEDKNMFTWIHKNWED